VNNASIERKKGEPRVGSPFLLLHRIVLCLLSTMLVLLAIASLRWPFYWDHGIFAWIGDTILRGGMPYRDAWDVKGPLTFYMFGLVEWLFGKAMWGIRVVDLMLLTVGLVAAARVVRRLSGSGAAAYTVLAVGFQYLGSGYSETAQPDGWAAILVLLALGLLVMEEVHTSLQHATLSALLFGTCLLFKPPFAVFLVAPALYVLLAPDLSTWAKLRGLVLTGTAFVLPALLCAGWFAWRGALSSLFDTYIVFNAQQASSPLPRLDTSLRGAVHRFSWRIFHNPALMLAGVAGVIGLLEVRRDRPRTATILATTILAGFFTVFVQQRYWNRYQWHVAYMLLTISVGIGLGRLWHRTRPERSAATMRPLALGIGAALVIMLFPPPWHQVHRWVALTLGRTTPAQYDSEFRDPALSWTVTDSRALARYVREHTSEGQRVLIWSDPLVNYLSDRPSTGRLIFFVPLNSPTSQRLRYRREFLRDFSSNPPRYFAVGRRNLVDADSLNHANISRRFPELHARLVAEYVPVTRFGDMEVFSRRTDQSAAPH
jgi:4-amino-4-deoxy-L-arabinose transferase-like glycosyltransferase